MRDEALRDDADERRRQDERVDAELEEPRDRGRRVVRVKRGEDHVAGERRLQRDLRRLAVADLAHHDDVRILPEDVAERLGEAEPDLRLHGDLVERLDDDLDRILDRDDVHLGRRDRSQERA